MISYDRFYCKTCKSVTVHCREGHQSPFWCMHHPQKALGQYSKHAERARNLIREAIDCVPGLVEQGKLMAEAYRSKN